MKRLLSVVLVLASIVLLSACSRPPWEWTGCYYHDDVCTQQSRDRMSQIVDALNAQDAAALKEMFTEYALARYSAEIDDGVAYLLSLFPQGDVVWQEEEGGAHPSWHNEPGRHAVEVSSSYRVSSAGNEYALFFLEFPENEIDPDNVGVYGMGAVLRTDSGNSNLEAAFRSWALTFDFYKSVSNPPGVFMGDSGQLSSDRMAQIVDALNARDAAALRDMFTAKALTAYSAEIDDGLEYLLSLFPNGDVVWQEDPGGSVIYERVYSDTKAVLLRSFHRVSSGGVDYRLFFADFTENTIDPDNVGIYAMGAVPISAALNEVPEATIYFWTSSFTVAASTPPGIYIRE